MKAEHRHELKTNELAVWIAHFPAWLNENLKTIIAALVIIAAAGGIYWWVYFHKEAMSQNEKIRFTALLVELTRNKQQSIAALRQGIDYSYTLIQTSNKLQDFANNTKDNNMSALAYIKSAEALRTELHYRVGNIEQRNYAEQITKARSLYQKALEKAQNNPSLKAQALFGLGLCEEELGNYESAKQIYTQIIEDPELVGTTAAAAADFRLPLVDEYKQKIVFLAPRPAGIEMSDIETMLPELDLGSVPVQTDAEVPNLPGLE